MKNNINISQLSKIDTTTSEFVELRKNNKIYVDKTAFIYKLCCDNSHKCLARPQGFGKTLLISTLEELFKHGVKPYDGHDSYFKGLAIESLWKDESTYHVFRLDFRNFRRGAFDYIDIFNEELSLAIKTFGNEIGYKYNEQDNTKRNLLNLIEFSKRKSIVILIDNYDLPLLFNEKDSFNYAKYSNELKDIVSVLKYCCGALKFAFLAGTTIYRYSSIAESGNHLQDLFKNKLYSSVVGFTKDELRIFFENLLTCKISNKKGCPSTDVKLSQVSNLISAINDHYGHYCFDGECSIEVMHPGSVLSYLSDEDDQWKNYKLKRDDFPIRLWTQMPELKHDFEILLQNTGITIGDFPTPYDFPEEDLFVQLFQSGFMSFCKNDETLAFFKNKLKLHFPNKEVIEATKKMVKKFC